MRPFKPTTSKPSPGFPIADEAIDHPLPRQGLEDIRKSVEPSFVAAGQTLDDETLAAIALAMMAAMTAARTAAIETVLALRASSK